MNETSNIIGMSIGLLYYIIPKYGFFDYIYLDDKIK